MKDEIRKRLTYLKEQHHALVIKKNEMLPGKGGVFNRYKNPVLTAAHTPLTGGTTLIFLPIPF
jgi:4-O-beta-D-mannosyl-D-glucose phosphorylase